MSAELAHQKADKHLCVVYGIYVWYCEQLVCVYLLLLWYNTRKNSSAFGNDDDYTYILLIT